MCLWIASLTTNSNYFRFNSCTAASVRFFERLELILKCNLVKIYYSQRIASIESSQISPVFPSDKNRVKLKIVVAALWDKCSGIYTLFGLWSEICSLSLRNKVVVTSSKSFIFHLSFYYSFLVSVFFMLQNVIELDSVKVLLLCKSVPPPPKEKLWSKQIHIFHRI